MIGLENGEYDLVYSQIREQAVADRLKRAGFKESRVHRNLPQVLMMKYNLEADLIPARRELDPKKREQMYHEIQRKLMRDVPMIPLMVRPEAILHSPKLQGMRSLEPVWGLDITHLTFN